MALTLPGHRKKVTISSEYNMSTDKHSARQTSSCKRSPRREPRRGVERHNSANQSSSSTTLSTSLPPRPALTRFSKSVNDLSAEVTRQSCLKKLGSADSDGSNCWSINGNKPRRTQKASCSPLNSSRVYFGNVTIIEFPTTIGDNPEVMEGCPIALDPNPLQVDGSIATTVLPVQEYERKSPRSTIRTSMKHLHSRNYYEVRRLNPAEREHRLQMAGYSIAQIEQGEKNAAKDRKRRIRSIRQVQWDGVVLFLEYTRRGLRKIIPV